MALKVGSNDGLGQLVEGVTAVKYSTASSNQRERRVISSKRRPYASRKMRMVRYGLIEDCMESFAGIKIQDGYLSIQMGRVKPNLR